MLSRPTQSMPAKKSWLKTSLMLTAGAATLAMAPQAYAQSSGDEVIVTGIRQSLENALVEKRQAASLVEVILAEDIGKLPDQNLAEVLENVTGIQITREEGVGVGVQIRGTDDNRVEINGVSTVGAGTGRGGISFEDISPAIIAGVEVIKAPEARTIEGAVGGTINLRTIRPLDLKDTLASVKFQLEDSSLSSDGLQPRVQGALGNKWENAKGQEIGVVLSGSYTESTNTAFRPRLDRDNITTCPDVDAPSTCVASGGEDFLGVQFLNQVQRTQDFETLNFAGSVEARPTPNLKLFADVIYNDQERRLSGSRVQASTVSRLNGDNSDRTNGDGSTFTAFETFNLGEVDGPNGTQDLGSILAVTQGSFTPIQVQGFDSATDGRGAPFLRVGSDAGSRLTESTTLRFGGEWEKDALTLSAEYSRSDSDTVNPNLSVNLNFINPNSFQSLTVNENRDADGDGNGTFQVGESRLANGAAPAADTFIPGTTDPATFVPGGTDLRDENGTPIVFDLTDGFGFGINFGAPFAPTAAQLLNADNYVVDGNPTFSADERENTEDALRLDASYDFADTRFDFLSSIDAGYRYSNRTSIRNDIDASVRGSGTFQNSLEASRITGLLNEIPDNFGEETGQALSVSGVLQVDPAFSIDPDTTTATINAAAVAQGLSPLFGSLESDEGAFFDVEEETHAIYGQVNFASEFNGITFRGNAGLRYVDTSIASTANVNTPAVAAVAAQPAIPATATEDAVPATAAIAAVPASTVLTTLNSSYDHFLPRFNLAIDVTDNIVLRGAYSQDINRPDFDLISSARTFPNFGGVNSNSVGGNPFLLPEEVEAFDVSVDWYFAPEAVLSVGYFRKERDGLFGADVDAPDETGGVRDTNGPVCEEGGIFSPLTSPGIFGATDLGVCVGNQTTFNSDGTTTQEGIEVALQYNLGQFEDRLGWASGFGIIANYTYQTEDNNSGFSEIDFGRANAIFDAQGFQTDDDEANFNPVFRETATLLNLSNHAYNLTGYYEKYGLTARLRYTWRDAFATSDLPGTGNVFTPLGFRGIVESRGQLNGSLSYDVTDHLTLNVDAVNLTESDNTVSCVSDGGLPCYQEVTDRRVLFGASYTF